MIARSSPSYVRSTADVVATHTDEPTRKIEANPKELVRRRSTAKQDETAGKAQRWSAITLAGVSLVALISRRLSYDGLEILAIELALGASLAGFALHVKKRPPRHDGSPHPWVIISGIVCLLVPWLADIVARRMGHGNDAEIRMMASLALGSLWLAMLSDSSRSRGLSIVCSGFLALFTTFIAESSTAVVYAYVWIAICLWSLLDTHWMRVEGLTASKVEVSRAAKWSYMVIGVLLFFGQPDSYGIEFLCYENSRRS